MYGKSDPFVKVYLDDTLLATTQVITDSLNPEWKEKFNIQVNGKYNTLRLEVWDQDVVSSDSLGTVKIPTSEIIMGKVMNESRTIDDPASKGNNGGTLKFNLLFVPQSSMYWNGGGKKRALLIGINYLQLPVGRGQLTGCVNDVKVMKNIITSKFGFSNDQIRILTDDGAPGTLQPTYQNILEGIRWLVSGAAPGDSLFFHFSGHGGQLPDQSGDEADGKDETLIPVDFKTSGQIIDDILFQELVKPVPVGARLTAFMDCCHSGTGLDLPFIYKTEGSKEVSPVKEGEPVGNHVVLISGCRDDQTAADAKLQGSPSGAMTFAFSKTVEEVQTPLTYIDLLLSLRHKLATATQKFTQVPQLSSSSLLDLKELFAF